MTDHIIRMEHCRQIGFCARGVRQWINRAGLDHMHFLQHGYPISKIEPIGDPMAKKLIAHVREEEGD